MRVFRKLVISMIVVSVGVSSSFSIAHEILGLGEVIPPRYVIGTSGDENYKILIDAEVDGFRVRQVRFDSTICSSGYHETLEIEGVINQDSTRMLSKVLPRLHQCVDQENNDFIPNMVFLSSNGGLLNEGYAAAKLFNEYNVEAVLYGDQKCASACATAFLGANTRSMRDASILSFHSPYRIQGKEQLCSTREEQAELKAFFVKQMGLEDGGFLFDRTMDRCSGDDLWELNRDAAMLLGLTTPGSYFDRHRLMEDVSDEKYLDIIKSRLKEFGRHSPQYASLPKEVRCNYQLIIDGIDSFRFWRDRNQDGCRGSPLRIEDVAMPIRSIDLAASPSELKIVLTGDYLAEFSRRR